MSMPEYALHKFMTTVPICVQTSSLASVLEIFSQGKCDRIAVVNEQQPIGIIKLQQLMPCFMTGYGRDDLDIQQPLWTLDVVEPIATLPADLSVEQFQVLCSQQLQINNDFNWALVDSEGKFIGLLDQAKLLQFFTLLPTTENSQNQHQPLNRQSLDHHQIASNENNVVVLNSLVQLLEQLPLPLMLQTSSGELVMQNPAWQQQFGTLNAPESVTQEVEALLKSIAPQVEVNQAAKFNNHKQFDGSGILEEVLSTARTQEYIQRSHLTAQLNNSSSLNKELATETSPQDFERYILNSQVGMSPDASPASKTAIPTIEAGTTSTYCQLGTQPNTCICALPVQDGQRVWEFKKIPLGGDRIALPLIPDLQLLIATDITQQQQLAAELAAKNADLIGLNRLKDEFLACISHELRTPITAVMGLSTLLKDQTLGQLNERQARYAGLIHQSGRHLMSVVNDILDLTRMESGQLNLSLEPVKIKTVCDRAIKQAWAMQPNSSSSAESNVTLAIETGLDILVADELRLRQMIIHLLSNAFKFTQVDGKIGLRVNHWEGWIAFTIWDTGIGIPEQQQHLIFQKFQQLENPLTRQFEGTGLGLVLTRALARLHGGDVSFLSKEGEGSSFTLLLPPSPPNHKRGGEEKMGGQGDSLSPCHLVTLSPCPSTPISQNHRSRLILIVEAAPRFIEDLTQQLTNLGYQFVIARSGTEALEKARRLQPGAIFLNPLLPLLSGWDVLTLLKSDVVTSKIPIIVTATIAEKEQAFSSRTDEFLSLPIQQLALQQILTRFCSPLSCYTSNLNWASDRPLIILHLVNSLCSISGDTPELLHLNPDSALNYRVLEADDLEQAELLARVWQPDVVLLDPISEPIYLQQLSQCPSLATLPCVTLDAATMQAAQTMGLSAFPYLPSTKVDPDALLSVLQIAAGRIWKARVLVVDVATLPDLQGVKRKKLAKHSSFSLGCECQALIQYLETAGFIGVIGHSWAEVLQQIEQQSVDLLLIYLANATRQKSVVTALKALQQPHLPPVLVLDQHLNYSSVENEDPHTSLFSAANKGTKSESSLDVAIMSNDNQGRGYATKVLSSSLAMAELLEQIYQTLASSGRHSV